MNLHYLNVIGGVGSIVLGTVGYAFVMYMLGARFQLHPLGIKIVNPSERLRKPLIKIVEKRMGKHPPNDVCSVHVHEQVMKKARVLRIEVTFGFLILILASILSQH